MAGYNIDPFGKMAETDRWISQDKLNRQQIAKQNALRDIQQQSAQLALDQQQGDADFLNALRTNPMQAQQDYKVRYNQAFPQAAPTKPVFKDLGEGDYGQAGLYDVSGQTPRYVGASQKKDPLVSVDMGDGQKLGMKPVVSKLAEWEEDANSQLSSISSIDMALDELETYGNEITGIKGNLKRALAPTAALLGFEIESMSSAELYKTITNKNAGSFRMEVVGPGPVSEYEQKILQAVSGGAMSYAEGAKALMLEYRKFKMRKINRYNKRLAGASKQKGFEYLVDIYSPVKSYSRKDRSEGQTLDSFWK